MIDNEWEAFCKHMGSWHSSGQQFWEYHRTKSEILKALLDDPASNSFPNIVMLMVIESVRSHSAVGKAFCPSVFGDEKSPKPLFLRGAHSAPARRIQAFLVSGLGRTRPGNQGGVTVTYTGTPGHNDGL